MFLQLLIQQIRRGIGKINLVPAELHKENT